MPVEKVDMEEESGAEDRKGKSLNIIHKYYDENFILEDDEEEEACFIRNKDGEVESKRASRRVCENVDEKN